MSFQFQCPQGHILEGDEGLAGQTCQCPECAILFIIPMPLAAPAAPVFTPAVREPEPPAKVPSASAAVQAPVVEPDLEPELLHIPCPKGHKLETPRDMLDQFVACPHCGSRFRLLERNSVEFKRKRREEEERRVARAGKLWFNGAIAVAVIILVFLVGLIVMQSSQ